ncbi:MAG: hypothetical protein Q4D38_05570 [Planctomycetia bacterium]|nr:hypothetical protein [Planctomycetia bacterium]
MSVLPVEERDAFWEFVRESVKSGESIEYWEYQGLPILYLAAQEGDLDLVRFLIDSGATTLHPWEDMNVDDVFIRCLLIQEREKKCAELGVSWPLDEDCFPCPICGKLSKDIKYFTFNSVAFFLLVYQLRTENCIACPACMRKKIGGYLIKYIFLGNLMYPWIFIAMMILLVRTWLPGPSWSLKRLLKNAKQETQEAQ